MAFAKMGARGGFGALGRLGGAGNSGPPFDIFVDSLNGNDSHAGTSVATAKQTIAAGQALLSAGKRIGLAKGSKWRELLTIAVNSVTVGSYGTGALPILDASDIISAGSWTKTAGLTSTYQASITFATGGNSSTWSNFFETGGPGDSVTGQFMSLQSSSATVDTVAGSYFVTGMSAAGGIPSGAVTIFVHAFDGSSPITNGYIYEFSNRLGGLIVSGAGVTISNIEARKNAGNDGAIAIQGASGSVSVSGIIARDGGKHVFIAPGGATITNSTFINSYYSSNSGGLAVIHEAVGSGLGATISSCIFQQDQVVDSSNQIAALISHTEAGSIGTINATGNWFIAKNSAYLGGIAFQNAVTNITGNFASQVQNFALFFGNATLTNNQAVTSFASNQLLATDADNLTISLSGNKFKAAHTSNGIFYLPNSHLTVTDSNGIYFIDSPGPNNGAYENFAPTTGNSITFNGVVFDGNQSTNMPIQIFGSGFTYIGGNISPNTFVAASNVNSWALNGTSYGSLAAWQGAGFDTNALTTGNGAFVLPTIPSVS